MARSRFHRSTDALPPLRLTRRDDAILRDVERLGPCLVEHLRRLHFPSYKTAAERAMKLFHHGFLERRPLPAESGQPAMAHVLAPRGVEHLAARGIRARTLPADFDEPHALAWAVRRTDVLSRLAADARHPGLELPLIEADPAGDGLMPDALVVLDVPSRLFRRVLLLDVLRDGPKDGLRERLEAWRAWASRPATTIEEGILQALEARDVARTRHRARVSIGLLVPDAATLDAAAALATATGCGALIHLAAAEWLHEASPLDTVWVQAQARARDGAAARMTSVLA